MKRNIRFYFAFYLAKLSIVALKTIRRDASQFPGKMAITLCPNFLDQIGKPEKIIAVTGTNGKTTCCNMIEDCLRANGYDFMDNQLGSNTNSGIASTFIKGAKLSGNSKKNLAVFEIDERSSIRIFPYVKPTYLVCTNLFRDSLMRNAHTEFISNMLTNNIPKETKLILNGDDLIVSNLAPSNDRVYFGIDRLPTDTDTCENIARDIIVCPKCDSKLVYDFVRYNHIGRAHCSKCDFKSPEIDYELTKLDLDNKVMIIKHNGEEEQYDLINNNIINVYNMLATITVLKEFGLSKEQINPILKKQKIVDTRYSKETVNGIEVVTQLSKGMNPIACSRAFDYLRKESGNKAAFILLDDLHDAANGSENIAWHYDTDYEFLRDESIKQILIAGARYLDTKIRLEMADIPMEKVVSQRDELSLIDSLKLDGIDKVFILHDLYAMDLKNKLKEKVIEKIEEEGRNK
ncbi:MAG: DUF1727 domain-containing protein [Clostridia bacterium]|nr:DUF1727 domain-containing protein [Clostridia bacterium]